MAHFRATIKGNRLEASRLGTKRSGIGAVVNGWHVGAEIDATHVNGLDEITVYMTNGSDHGPKTYTCIGLIQETENGPLFIPMPSEPQ